MTSSELTTEQRKLIDTIASDNGFSIYQINAVSGSVKGDNYLGVIKSVTITEGEKKLELILKSAHSGEFRNQMPIRQAYQREIFVYENVFARFKEFQDEYGLTDPFRSHPKLYATCDTESSECLVLENLRDKGYKLWNRKRPMDPEHLRAVIKEYAKFHAVSLAMNEKKPDVFKELSGNMEKNIFEGHIVDKEKAAMYIKSVMGNIWGVFEDDPVTTEVLKRFEEQLPDIFMEMTEQSDHAVIDHGDCWCNNLMFVYENEDNPKSPSDVRIIDWQLSKTTSPAMDLAYFFLIHSPKETLHDYEKYLKLYHDTLSKNLQEFSCDAEKVFSYADLLRHWNEKTKIGVYMSFMVLKLMLCESDEAPDFSEISESGKSIMESFQFATKDTDAYSLRIRDLVEFAIEKGYL